MRQWSLFKNQYIAERWNRRSGHQHFRGFPTAISVGIIERCRDGHCPKPISPGLLRSASVTRHAWRHRGLLSYWPSIIARLVSVQGNAAVPWSFWPYCSALDPGLQQGWRAVIDDAQIIERGFW